MRLSLLLLVVGTAMQAATSVHPTIHHLNELRALEEAQAEAGIRCDVVVTVTMFNPSQFQFFVQENEVGVYVWPVGRKAWILKAGDQVRIVGKSARGSYAPILDPEEITTIRFAGLPLPLKPPSWSEARNSDRFDERFAEVSGRLMSLKPYYREGEEGRFGTEMELWSRGETIRAIVNDPTGQDLSSYVQADVILRGVITPSHMVHEQRHDAWLSVGSLDSVILAERHSLDWGAYPMIPLSRLLAHHGSGIPRSFFRTEGVVTYADDVTTVTLQDGRSTVTAIQAFPREIRVGRRFEVLGRLARGDRDLFRMEQAQFREIGPGTPIPPREAPDSELGSGELEGEIVTATGLLSDVALHRQLCILHLQTTTLPWEALWPNGPAHCPTWIPAGSEVKVTGRVQHRWMEGRRFPVQTTILARSPGDVQVISQPAWWRRLPIGKLLLAAGAAVLLALVWIGQLRRRVKAQISRIEEQKVELEKSRQRAEEASRLKSEFLANMSHEIRTPMNGVLGLTEVVLETNLTPEQRADLISVRSSADSLLTILNDILDFSKIEAGKLMVDPIPFSLRDCVEETIRAVSLSAGRKPVEFVCDIDGDVPDVVVGDPTRLRQILLNLGGNAVKFTERGEVSMEVEVESTSDGTARLHFTVSDTGIGVPAEKQAAIFEAFVQADASTTRKHGGSGLGLAISSRLVQMMNGRIWVESEPGSGSRFHFTAEFGTADGAPPTAATVVSDLAAMGVLIVDDNAVNRRVLADTVTRWGMRPSLAANAHDAMVAIECAAKSGTPFPLVLSDMNMPETNGFELAERIMGNPRLRTKIILLTSGAQSGDTRCREAGVVAGQLTKPVRRAELLAAIGRALGVERAEVRQAEVGRPKPSGEGGAALRILVAEDNPINQHLMLRLLDKGGHKVVLVDNGEDELKALEQESFDLVLTDIQMPRMDGLEVAQRIRAAEKATGAHRRMFAMTAHAMTGDRERCLAAGMDGYLPKPIRPRDLAAILAAVQAEIGGAPVAGAQGKGEESWQAKAPATQ